MLPAQPEAESRRAKDVALLEQVLERNNMLRALQRVERNGGAPGIDGMRTEELRAYLKENWQHHRRELLEGTYEPKPVRRVEIPKPDGGVRLLGIPTVLDRLIQQALLQQLTPIYEAEFSTSSYGFRPGRSAHDAVKAAQSYIREGHSWVVDMDLEKFFDRVNHDKLMARVARKVADPRVLRLIRRYLESGVMLNGVVVSTEEGTPQGGPLSPLLANVMLHDLDRELERRGHRFARYADDCNIYVKSRRAGERVMKSVRRFLEERLSLKVNEAKSAVDRPWKRKFLGFSFLPGKAARIRVAPKSLKRAKEKLRELTKRSRSQSMEHRIQVLNKYVTGWVGYYSLAETPSIFVGLDEWLRRRLRMVLWKQWKRAAARFHELHRLGVPKKTARMTAGTSKGPWRAAGSPPVQQALNNAYWRGQGLVSLSERYQQLCSIS